VLPEDRCFRFLLPPLPRPGPVDDPSVLYLRLRDEPERCALSATRRTGHVTSANQPEGDPCDCYRKPDWWDETLKRVGSYLNLHIDAVESLGRKVIATSDAIRYTQVGNPERIVIKSAALLRAVGYDVGSSGAVG
jgi:hypothetical protein